MLAIEAAKGIVFRELGLSIASREERVICQKKVFLLKCLGADFMYKFVQGDRGPWSTELTDELIDNLDYLLAQSYKNYVLADKVREQIEKVNMLVRDGDKYVSKAVEASRYEFLAMLVWVSRGVAFSPNSMYGKIGPLFPQYRLRDYADARERLLQAGLLTMK